MVETRQLTPSQRALLETERQYWPDELAFPETVYADRLALVQQGLVARRLTAALFFDPENMYWLTGYQTIGYFTFQAMLVPVSGKPIVVSRVVNRDMALALPTIADVCPIFDTDDPMDILVSFLSARLPDGMIGIETTSRYLNVADYMRLADALASRLAPVTGLIEPNRLIKSEAEIDRMRAAARAIEAGMTKALKSIAPGRTDNDLAAALYEGSIASGSEYIGHPPMVVTGPRSALCFALWKRKTMQAGDVVLLEGAGCVDRYHAIMARSAVLGKATDVQKETAQTLIDVLETAIETIRPGMTSGDVDAICRAMVEARGLGRYFKSRTGYGIGIGFPPNWAEGHIYAIRPNDPLVLEPNMTFHIIPTMFREDFGMAISDSVRVTDDGCELLTHLPRDLLEVGI